MPTFVLFPSTVPPEKPLVRGADGRELLDYEIGPFEVDQDLQLDCEVAGGDPAPKVTWWRGGALFDSSHEVTRRGTVRNRMVYRGLSREDLGAKFVCQVVQQINKKNKRSPFFTVFVRH